MVATLTGVRQSTSAGMEAQRLAQEQWCSAGVSARLRVLRKARSGLASIGSQLVDAMPTHLSRTRADSYVAEILPLLSACKFLEKRARAILKVRRLGTRGRPFWLSGVGTTVERVPFGVVLVIAPSNYPLFLAGVQTVQALAAGNAVVWKPGLGGRAVALLFASTMEAAGLPRDLLQVTEDSAAAGASAIDARPDKIVFTGSAGTGREVLRLAAERAIPVVAELSGCDALVVLPSADDNAVVAALSFAMRLNGSCTCMAPRRLILVGDGHERVLLRLRERFTEMKGIALAGPARKTLEALLRDAEDQGATVHGSLQDELVKPILVEDGDPGMQIAQADIFAPVITVLRARNMETVIEMDRLCPFGLTAAIFGDEVSARSLSKHLNVGTVTVNDLIVPTADPRVPFGGRRGSGFGVTRGAEGLLEMTAPKTVAVRRRVSVRQYEATDGRHESLFAGVVALGHAATILEKLGGLRRATNAAIKFKKSQAGFRREQ